MTWLRHPWETSSDWIATWDDTEPETEEENYEDEEEE